MWTYDLITSPQISRVRLLVSDTDSLKPVFQDEEITAMYEVQRNMFVGSFAGAFRPSPMAAVSPLRVAALLLDALAGNRARLASLTKLLDVTLSPATAATALHDQAEAYRTLDDNSGSFAIVEQVTTQWSFVDRFWRQWQRQTGVGAV